MANHREGIGPGMHRDHSSTVPAGATCRLCDSALTHSFVDLGMSPLCESYVAEEELDRMEPFYPLHALICGECWLVQLREYVSGEEIFGGEYAYFSSYSDSWVEHVRRFVEGVTDRFGLDAESQVVEVASNDGYLLQHFLPLDVPVLGIEPAENVAEAAREKGIPTRTVYLGADSARKLAAEDVQADLLVGNNVLAHVPDLNDFVEGLRILLAPDGVLTMEFPHLMRLVAENQFDTIYHEHYSYFSFVTAERVFDAHDLTVFDVEELPTHGGSLRVYVRHRSDDDGREPAVGDGAGPLAVTDRVRELREQERAAGVESLPYYRSFAERVRATKRKLLSFLIEVHESGKSVVGYGAPGKGNTLLNYCGIGTDLLDYTVDRSEYKQGMYTPGTHIPIHDPGRIGETRPDYVLILPWNLEDEIVDQMSHIHEWGGRFVVPIPEVKVLA
jgi:SAM-dependent methyltransferase